MTADPALIYNPNRQFSDPARGSGAVITYGRNTWHRTGHCRRCVNGLPHIIRRRGAGGERPTGLLLQRPGAHVYEDEMAPGEKTVLRRIMRAREKHGVDIAVDEEYSCS